MLFAAFLEKKKSGAGGREGGRAGGREGGRAGAVGYIVVVKNWKKYHFVFSMRFMLIPAS